MLKFALPVAALLLAAPLPVSAKTDPATWVKHIETELDAINRKQKWLPEGEARGGVLAAGGEARLDYALAPGTAYRLILVCEQDCAAGEAELIDPSGAGLGDPKPLVNMPAFEATPPSAGTYALKVRMTDCAVAQCVWSARLYARR
jgi:hypothetical protein